MGLGGSVELTDGQEVSNSLAVPRAKVAEGTIVRLTPVKLIKQRKDLRSEKKWPPGSSVGNTGPLIQKQGLKQSSKFEITEDGVPEDREEAHLGLAAEVVVVGVVGGLVALVTCGGLVVGARGLGRPSKWPQLVPSTLPRYWQLDSVLEREDDQVVTDQDTQAL